MFLVDLLFVSKVASEINMWSREEMVDLFLDGICESQDVKNFIELKFPGDSRKSRPKIGFVFGKIRFEARKATANDLTT